MNHFVDQKAITKASVALRLLSRTMYTGALNILLSTVVEQQTRIRFGTYSMI
jgi:hypothetical protein